MYPLIVENAILFSNEPDNYLICDAFSLESISGKLSANQMIINFNF